jgi:hypothetical protein
MKFYFYEILLLVIQATVSGRCTTYRLAYMFVEDLPLVIAPNNKSRKHELVSTFLIYERELYRSVGSAVTMVPTGMVRFDTQTSDNRLTYYRRPCVRIRTPSGGTMLAWILRLPSCNFSWNVIKLDSTEEADTNLVILTFWSWPMR